MRQLSGIAAFVALLLFPAMSFADPINIGLISFDITIPNGPTAGVNAFNISNLTGDPAGGGFALPPDFPVMDPLILLQSSLTLVEGGITTTILLGDIGFGVFGPTTSVEFPATSSFSSAVFTGTLNQTHLSLADGSTFVASSLVIATLLPSSGSSLEPGVDFALLSAAPVPVPEAATWILLGTGLAALIGIRTRQTR